MKPLPKLCQVKMLKKKWKIYTKEKTSNKVLKIIQMHSSAPWLLFTRIWHGLEGLVLITRNVLYLWDVLKETGWRDATCSQS